MSDPTDSQVLLKLIIRGMEPDEVARLADQTYGQLKSEAAQHIDALTAYYKQAAQAQTDSAKAAAQEKIDAETQALDAVTKLMRQQEIEANRARNAWHGIMEDLENITTVARGAFDVMSDGFERLKAAAEEIARDTKIYNSLTGSIEEMKTATDGTVSNLDLISAKNRAFEKDLHLTDSEFGVVAAAAKHYADAIGIGAKEALDQLMDGMATGRTKMLEHAGIVVDAAEANQKWADKMGTTVDQMTSQDKLLALQAEALEKMRLKMDDVGDGTDKLADRFERGFVRIKNMISDTAAALGNIDVGGLFYEPGTNAAAHDAAMKRYANQAQAALDQAHADLGAPDESNKPYLPGVGGMSDADRAAGGKNKKGVNSYQAQAEQQREAGAASYDAFIGKLGSSQGPTTQAQNSDDDLAAKASLYAGDTSAIDDYVKAAEAANAADEKRVVMFARTKGIALDAGVAYQKLADSLGLEVDQLTHEEKLNALSNEQKIKADELAKKVKKEADARRAELKATKNKAGFLSMFLWGEDGPDQTYNEMDTFNQRLVDSTKQMSDMIGAAGQSMAGAMGQSLAATLAGAAGHKKSMKEMTFDTLEALSQQAIVRALFSTAEGIADLAHYDYPGAAESFAAAAAFAAVGVAAGVGAHAVGATAPPTQQQQWDKQYQTSQDKKAYLNDKYGGGTSTSTAGNQGATGSRSSSSMSSDSQAPIIINQTIMPGGEAEAGRQVKKALDALSKQTGQQLLAS